MDPADLDTLWLFLAAIMVLSMQAGFLLLEAGRVRAKNSVNVAQKNVADLVVSWSLFFMIGYWLMFGTIGPLGGASDTSASLHFLYQLGFCATAASIVSGGVAERITFIAYLALAALTSALIYPLVGRWVWGGLGPGPTGSWLGELGFVDFAGSTVVHGVGAWVALAAILVIGPREGRFDADGSPRAMPGHSAVLSLLGVLILLIGWFGFNAGSLSPDDPRFASTVFSTMTAAVFGAAIGTLAVALVGDASALPAGSRPAQLVVQLGGVVAVFAFTWTVTWGALHALARYRPLRVTALQERLGLNQTEHGEALGAERLQRALNDRLQAPTAGARTGQERLTVDSGDEAAELAMAMNELLARQEEATRRISASEQRCEQFANTASDWLWETDATLCLSFVSTREGLLDEASRRALHGRSLAALIRLRPAESRIVGAAIGARRPIPSTEVALLLDDRSRRIVELRGVPYRTEEGAFLGYRGTFHDVTERRDAERRAVFLSRHDTLTGLANRRALADRLQRLLARNAAGQGTIVACIDLDGFKAVNDGHGHAIGDRLLTLVGKRLRLARRQADEVFRTGGDEFVLVSPAADLDTIRDAGTSWGNRLIASLSAPYELDALSLKIGASVGLAFAPEHAGEPDALVHLADLALYAAKEAGKGQVVWFEPEMDGDARRQVEIEERLRGALAGDELTVQYQPQYLGSG